MLQKQIFNLPFAFGVDTKTDPKQIRPGKLALLQNGYFYTPQEIRKRPGFIQFTKLYADSANGTFGQLAAAYGLWTRNDGKELLTADGQYLYSYAPAFGDWIRKSPYAPANSPTGTGYIPTTLRIDQIQRETDTLSAPNSAVGGNIQAFVWQAKAATVARTTIVDGATGTNMAYDLPVGNQNVTHPSCPKVFYFADTRFFLYIVWEKVGGVAPRLAFYYVDLNTAGTLIPFAALAAPITAIADVGGLPVYDACQRADGSVVVAYRNATDDISAVIIQTDTSRGAPVAITTTVETPTCLSVWFSASQNQIYFAWTNAVPRGTWVVWNGALTAVISGRTVFMTRAGITFLTGVASPSADSSSVFYEESANVYRADLNSLGAFNDVGVVCANAQIATKALATNVDRAVIWIGYKGVSTSVQPTYFLLSEAAFTATVQNLVIAQAALGTAGGAASFSRVPEFNRTSTANVFETALLQADRTTVVGGNVNFQDGVMSATVQLYTTATSSELANTLHLTGGLLWSYDGASMVEQNFLLFPECTNAVNTPGAGLSAGSYQYVATYEWMDAQGQLHQSTPSVPRTVIVVGGATGTVLSSFLNLWVTNKTQPNIAKINLAIYRTEANSAGPFYRVSGYEPNSLDTKFGVGVGASSYTDTLPDATLIGNQQLYTTGGEVPNAAPPPSLATATFKNRLISVDATSRMTWYYSKEIIQGVPVEFSPDFSQQVDERGGDISAVGVLDDKLIFFKKRAVFLVVGDGPASSGANSDYTPGTFITTDAGALSQTSLVSMPDGLMFQSEKGIELLTRGMTVMYIGAEVEQYTNAGRVVSATLQAPLSQVKFILDTGVCLVYDYYTKDQALPGQVGVGQWSVYTNHTSVATAMWNNGDAVGGVFVRAVGDGSTLLEAGTSDAGTFITLTARSAWLSMAGIQGFQRIYKAMVLGDFESAHQLNVQVAYDFDPTVTQTEAIPVPTAPANQYQWRILLNRQKCEAAQFTISDSFTTALGESLRLSGLALEVGAKQGLQKSPQTKTYG